MSLLEKTISAHQSTDAAELNKLSYENDITVKISIANNIHTDPGTLTRLSKNSNPLIAPHIAGNRNTPKDLIISYALKDTRRVSIAALSNPSLTLGTLETFNLNSNTCDGIAQNPNCSADLLHKIAKYFQSNKYSTAYGREYLMGNIIGHANVKPKTLKLFYPNPNAWKFLVNSNKVSSEFLVELSDSNITSLMLAIYLNPIFPTSLIDDIDETISREVVISLREGGYKG